GSLKLDLAQYRELAAFAQFSTDVDEATKKQIDRGARMLELLKQGRYEPMQVAAQVAIIWAGTKGYLDDLPVSSVGQFERAFLSYLERAYKKTLTAITREHVITDDIEKSLEKAVSECKKSFTVK
ncbi:F0F1 ATP synthase subunit alpha, partial [Candidatus Gottesmanbacteria bacterium]|nr:F0F1 ATP synthase subunit alpha [Candidatus Gottesmanbacteria bacterium]